MFCIAGWRLSPYPAYKGITACFVGRISAAPSGIIIGTLR
jgi:hypothetical protein